MEIKRKIELFSATSRRVVVKQPVPNRKMSCPSCGNGMLTAEQVAKMFDISQRIIFKLVEAGSVHFTEEKGGELMICLDSIMAISNGDTSEEESMGRALQFLDDHNDGEVFDK